MSRIATITTKHLTTHNIFLWVFNLGIAGACLTLSLFSTWIRGIQLIFYIYMPMLFLHRVMSRLRDVSFDNEFVYYTHNGYEVQVPMYDIASVEITSLGGLYKINLIVPTQIGMTIYFKPSIWYPLNFSKHDEKVNVLRSKIISAKRNRQPDNFRGLSSHSIEQEG